MVRRRFINLLPIAAVLLPVLMLSLAAWLSWRSALEDSTIQLRRTADAGAEYGARSFEAFAVAVARMNERLRGLSDADIQRQQRLLHEELQRLVDELPQSELAYVIDRDAVPLLASNIYPARRDTVLNDRDYFAALSGPNPPETYVSQTFFGRTDGRLLFAVARRRRDTGNLDIPPGGFDGVIIISIQPNAVAEGMRRLLGNSDDVLALIRSDGQILSRTTGQVEPLPPVPPGRPFHNVVASGAASGVYESFSVVEGTSSLAAVRRVDGFPVYAVSLRPRSVIVAHWRRTVAGHLVFGIPATLMLLALSLRVRLDQLRLGALNDSLERDVQRGSDRLSRAARFGLVATFEIDLRSGVNLRSAEYMSIAGHQRSPAQEKHADWVRRLHPDDRDRAERHFLDSISHASGATSYAQSYRVVTPSGEIRWIAAQAEIERDAAGHAVMMRGAHVDVTPLRSIQLALAESDARLRLAQDGLGIGIWEWQPGTRALTWSAKMIELWGFDAAAGQPGPMAVIARIHPQDRRRVLREVAQMKPGAALRSEFRILRPGGEGRTETVWIMARASLLPPEGGPQARLMGLAYDVTDRKLAEEETTLLAREVEHRAKNTLALVLGLLRVTRAETKEEFTAVIQGRVEALSRTMTLLGEQRWHGAGLGDILRQELAPFEDGQDGRLQLSGPNVTLEPEVAQSLSMALHELTTNAAKYGALSLPEGRLVLDWQVRDGVLHLVWREVGGPELEGSPQHVSFGSQLIDQTFRDRLGGQIEYRWERSGLVCEISFPLEVE